MWSAQTAPLQLPARWRAHSQTWSRSWLHGWGRRHFLCMSTRCCCSSCARGGHPRSARQVFRLHTLHAFHTNKHREHVLPPPKVLMTDSLHGVQAAIGAVEAAGVLFPLPITLHHVVPSLIACLGSGPDVAVAFIHVASSIGGATVARHVLPSLLALLISGGARLPAKQQPLRSAGEPSTFCVFVPLARNCRRHPVGHAPDSDTCHSRSDSRGNCHDGHCDGAGGPPAQPARGCNSAAAGALHKTTCMSCRP